MENHGKPSVGLGFYQRTKWKRYLRHWNIAGWFFKADDHSFAMAFFNACGPGPCFWSSRFHKIQTPTADQTLHGKKPKSIVQTSSKNKDQSIFSMRRPDLEAPLIYSSSQPRNLFKRPKAHWVFAMKSRKFHELILDQVPTVIRDLLAKVCHLGLDDGIEKDSLSFKIKQRFLHTLHWNKH